MKIQFYSASVIESWCCQGEIHQHNEVHFALFGRDVQNNEAVALMFRYCL